MKVDLPDPWEVRQKTLKWFKMDIFCKGQSKGIAP
jgi:hypothetical protein